MLKGYGPDSPPPAACVAPFAVVSTTAGFQAAYDPNGNMLLRVEVSGARRITYLQEYDAENRLAAVTNTVPGAVVRFVYDGDGHRILRIGPEGTTVTLGDHYEQTGARSGSTTMPVGGGSGCGRAAPSTSCTGTT